MKILLLVSCLLLLNASCSREPEVPVVTESLQLAVKGMTCDGCVAGITGKLMKTPGVISCDVNLEAESAVIEINPARIDGEQLVKLIDQLGYTASLNPAE